jgi:hypothetical protein
MVATGVNGDGLPRGPGPAGRHVRNRCGVERVLRRPRRPRPVRGRPGHLRRPRRAGRGHRANLPGASWQRCRTHYAANLMSICPKIACGQRSRRCCTRCTTNPTPRPCTPSSTGSSSTSPTSCPPSREHLERPRGHPRVHRLPQGRLAQIWSNNPNERLNREIRRRTDVVGHLPQPRRDHPPRRRRPGRATRRMGRRPPLPRPRSPHAEPEGAGDDAGAAVGPSPLGAVQPDPTVSTIVPALKEVSSRGVTPPR